MENTNKLNIWDETHWLAHLTSIKVLPMPFQKTKGRSREGVKFRHDKKPLHKAREEILLSPAGCTDSSLSSFSPIFLLIFPRNKQCFSLSLEKSWEVPVLFRVTAGHTRLFWREQARHSLYPHSQQGDGSKRGTGAGLVGIQPRCAPTWLQQQRSCTASVQDVLITSGKGRLRELGLFSPAWHPLRGDLIAVHKHVNRPNSREEPLKLKEDTGTGANRAKAQGKKMWAGN